MLADVQARPKGAASPGLAVFTPIVQSGRELAAAADKAANALHNPVTLPVVCQSMLLRSNMRSQER
jgi:hypothetical protein